MNEKELKKTGREGENLLKQKKQTQKQITTKNNLTSFTEKINNKIKERVKEHIQEGIKNGYNIILHELNSKKPNWLRMKASDYKADLQTLLIEYRKNPYGFGYGVVVGKQLKDFYLVVIDMDIDTEECKKRISKELEELLNKHGIRYYKEITKNKRIHYKIVLDRITDKIDSISKLPYPGTCSKFKDGKELPGEIELFTKKNKFIIVYDGIINDNKPFFTQEPVINDYQAFENFLEDWISKYKPNEKEPKKEPKEPIKEPIKEPEKEDKSLIQFSKIVEAFKIVRKYNPSNGWEAIDRLFSAYCVINNIPEEETIKGFKDIWEEEFKEKPTDDLVQNTLRRYKTGDILPGLGSIIMVLKEVLNTEGLSEYERELLKAVLNDLKNKNIPGRDWKLENNGWCIYTEGGEYIQVLPYFEITSHFLINGEEYIEITDKKGNTYIKRVERKKDSYLPDVSIVKDFGVINPDKVKEAKRFLAHYIEKVKAENGVKVDFIGYKYNNDWDIVVAGNGYSRKELGYIFYGKEVSNRWFIPGIKGNPEKFKRVFKELFYLNDEPLHLAISDFLSWIGKEFLKEDMHLENNPILALIGDTGTGKSIRLKIATALYGNPVLFSYTNMTQAGLNNRFPLLKASFGIDEVVIRTFEDFLRFEKVFYNITNEQGKIISNGTYDPIEVPIAITGETENLQIDKLLDRGRGLNRRLIVIKMTDYWKENSEVLDNALDELQAHHGHILGYVRSLKEEDKKEITDLIKGIQARLNFGDSSFKDLRKHLALSLAMYYHFYERYIGIDAVKIADKVNTVIDFVVEQINDNQANRIGENTDYVGEIINFIAKVEEAFNNRKSLKGFSYSQVCNTIGYTPSNRVGELLKKFFWKKYSSNGKVIRLSFYPGALLVNPYLLTANEKFSLLKEDKSRLEELSEEEISIWFEVLTLRYDTDTARRIIQDIGDNRLNLISNQEEKGIQEGEVEL
jgi:hypothetical protein